MSRTVFYWGHKITIKSPLHVRYLIDILRIMIFYDMATHPYGCHQQWEISHRHPCVIFMSVSFSSILTIRRLNYKLFYKEILPHNLFFLVFIEPVSMSTFRRIELKRFQFSVGSLNWGMTRLVLLQLCYFLHAPPALSPQLWSPPQIVLFIGPTW